MESDDVMPANYLGYGDMVNMPPDKQVTKFISTGTITGWDPGYGAGFQATYDKTRLFQMLITAVSKNAYIRMVDTGNAAESKDTIPWILLQKSAVSDKNFKEVTGELDVNESLSNIEKMNFKTFYYLDDEKKSPRRGIIAQDIEEIDPEYVHSSNDPGRLTVDSNPLLMDALAAIKALSAKIKYLESRLNLRADVRLQMPIVDDELPPV